MAILSSLRRWLGPGTRYDVEYAGPAGGGISAVLEMPPDELYHTQPHLRTVVAFLARNVAQLPLQGFQRVADNDRRRITDDPLMRALRQPNPSTTGYELLYSLVATLKVYDRAVWMLTRETLDPPTTQYSTTTITLTVHGFGFTADTRVFMSNSATATTPTFVDANTLELPNSFVAYYAGTRMVYARANSAANSEVSNAVALPTMPRLVGACGVSPDGATTANGITIVGGMSSVTPLVYIDDELVGLPIRASGSTLTLSFDAETVPAPGGHEVTLRLYPDGPSTNAAELWVEPLPHIVPNTSQVGGMNEPFEAVLTGTFPEGTSLSPTRPADWTAELLSVTGSEVRLLVQYTGEMTGTTILTGYLYLMSPHGAPLMFTVGSVRPPVLTSFPVSSIPGTSMTMRQISGTNFMGTYSGILPTSPVRVLLNGVPRGSATYSTSARVNWYPPGNLVPGDYDLTVDHSRLGTASNPLPLTVT